MTARISLLAALTALTIPKTAVAQMPTPAPVDHPALTLTFARTPNLWRSGIGGFGETLARADLEARGYYVSVLKLPSNQGIDLVAIKRSAAGQATDVKLVEVKTHRGRGAARLSNTSIGPQLSRQWLADRLLKLRAMGAEGRSLARDVYHFRKATGVPIERLGEFHDINLRSGRYVVRDPLTGAARGIRDTHVVLASVRNQHPDPQITRWAARHIAGYESIRMSGIRDWLAATRYESRAAVAVTRGGRSVLSATAKASRALARAAGPLSLLASAAIDGYELYTLTTAYNRGDLSGREYSLRVTKLVGGWTGATLGATGGAYIGASVGAFCGGWGAPIGGVIGAGIGGLVGYFGGSYVTEQIVTTWYASLDSRVTAGISNWFINGPCPTGLAER